MVWASVGASVRASVGASVRDSVRASVWDSVFDSVGASVGDSVWDSVWDSVYGQHDVQWLSFYDYFNKVLNLKKETKKLTGLFELAKSAGWALPHQNICWISERHNILERDENGRLHNLFGPAVVYPDGWSIYAVHGVRLPGWIIETPKKITPKNIESESNIEIRRVMIEKYGQDKYLIDSGAIEISRDSYGTLYRKDISNDEPLVMVKVANSTRESDGKFKKYFLRVMPDIKTAREAVAWTFGMKENEYQPHIET